MGVTATEGHFHGHMTLVMDGSLAAQLLRYRVVAMVSLPFFYFSLFFFIAGLRPD